MRSPPDNLLEIPNEAGYWLEQLQPLQHFNATEHLLHVPGRRHRIAQRIARKVYGIAPDLWSQRARSFVL